MSACSAPVLAASGLTVDEERKPRAGILTLRANLPKASGGEADKRAS